jgi:hypothetical protein
MLTKPHHTKAVELPQMQSLRAIQRSENSAIAIVLIDITIPTRLVQSITSIDLY